MHAAGKGKNRRCACPFVSVLAHSLIQLLYLRMVALWTFRDIVLRDSERLPCWAERDRRWALVMLVELVFEGFACRRWMSLRAARCSAGRPC